MPAPVILHIDTGRTFRGGQRQLWLMSGQLHKMGIRQVIACPHESELRRRINDLSTIELSNYSMIRKMSCSSLVRAINEYGVNIIHAHDSEAHSIGIRLKIKHPEIRLVVTRRVVFAPSGAISRRFKYRKYVDHFVAISRAVAESLKKMGISENSISVIPSALDIEDILAASPDSSIRSEIPGDCGFLIVTAGALTAEKDFETAVRAIKIATEKAADIGMIILGKGPEGHRLKRLIARENIKNIRFLGYREPMAPIFKTCGLFLLTSVSEGLNSSAIEAAACGLPLVVSNVGGLPEIAETGYNGLLCEPGRPESFADAIMRLYNDPEMRKNMAENSVTKAKQFDIEPAAQKIVELYNRLLAE